MGQAKTPAPRRAGNTTKQSKRSIVSTRDAFLALDDEAADLVVRMVELLAKRSRRRRR